MNAYLDEVDLIHVCRLTGWFLTECNGDQDLDEELEVDVPDAFLTPTLPFANFVHRALLMETCENCEELFQTRFWDQRWEDVIGLTETQGGLKIEEAIQSWLEKFGYWLELFLKKLDKLRYVLILHSVKHVLDLGFSYLPAIIIPSPTDLCLTYISTDTPLGRRVLDYIMMNQCEEGLMLGHYKVLHLGHLLAEWIHLLLHLKCAYWVDIKGEQFEGIEELLEV